MLVNSNHKRAFIISAIVLGLLLSLGIYNRLFKHKVNIIAKVNEIGMFHWGKGYYKQIVRYKYTLRGNEYSGEFTAGQLKGKFSKADYIVIRIDTLRPEKSKYIERMKPAPNILKTN